MDVRAEACSVILVLMSTMRLLFFAGFADATIFVCLVTT